LLFLSSDADPGPRHPMLLPLLHGTLAGVAGAFSTADLFNLYVWFEVMLICALGLFAIGGRIDQLDATFKYLTLNLLGTLLLLTAIAVIYGATGHLNFDALRESWRQLPPGLSTALLAALSIALLLKAAAFPLFSWLPASYHTLPAPVLALVAGLLTKVGVYACCERWVMSLRLQTRSCSKPWAGSPRLRCLPACWGRLPLGHAAHPRIPYHQPDRLHPAGHRTRWPGR
jgi:multicomponent Na+:H+ antiporter subunit D